jgi:hypothetical protein
VSRKRKHKRNRSILEDLGRRVATRDKNAKFVIDAPGQISMSDAISQLIEPFREDAPDLEAFRNLVTFACLAWNLCLLPVKEQDAAINKVVATAKGQPEDALDMLGLITELMDRKRKLFPHVSRMIMDYKVTERGNDFHIAIASTLESENVEE